MIFACLTDDPDDSDIDEFTEILAPYTEPFGFGGDGYRQALHEREVVDANWLLLMVNNRECCHCKANHKNLTKLFDTSSFNGARTDDYVQLLHDAAARWDSLELAWKEQAFQTNDSCRVARYPMRPGYKSITFHVTSDHIAANWVLPLDATRCVLYTSWIVRADAEEGIDYDLDHLAAVWRVTNAEDAALCSSMTGGAKSSYYRPGPFSDDEKFCTQFCDWFVRHSN